MLLSVLDVSHGSHDADPTISRPRRALRWRRARLCRGRPPARAPKVSRALPARSEGRPSTCCGAAWTRRATPSIACTPSRTAWTPVETTGFKPQRPCGGGHAIFSRHERQGGIAGVGAGTRARRARAGLLAFFSSTRRREQARVAEGRPLAVWPVSRQAAGRDGRRQRRGPHLHPRVPHGW